MYHSGALATRISNEGYAQVLCNIFFCYELCNGFSLLSHAVRTLNPTQDIYTNTLDLQRTGRRSLMGAGGYFCLVIIRCCNNGGKTYDDRILSRISPSSRNGSAKRHKNI